MEETCLAPVMLTGDHGLLDKTPVRTNGCGATYLVDPAGIVIVDVSEGLNESDKEYILRQFENDEATVIVRGAASRLNEEMWTWDFIATRCAEVSWTKFKHYKSDGVSWREAGWTTMTIAKYDEYLKSAEAGQSRTDVFYLLDFPVTTYIPEMMDDLRANYRLLWALPGEEQCALGYLSRKARPPMGPNLYVTPAHASTWFHEDGHGTVDSGHQCLFGQNRVIMLHRETAELKTAIMRTLKSGSYVMAQQLPHDEGAKPAWPSRALLREATLQGMRAHEFTLLPGDFCHIPKGRPHAFYKKPSAARECISFAWDWQYRGRDMAAMRAEASVSLTAARHNSVTRTVSLGIPAAALWHGAFCATARGAPPTDDLVPDREERPLGKSEALDDMATSVAPGTTLAVRQDAAGPVATEVLGGQNVVSAAELERVCADNDRSESALHAVATAVCVRMSSPAALAVPSADGVPAPDLDLRHTLKREHDGDNNAAMGPPCKAPRLTNPSPGTCRTNGRISPAARAPVVSEDGSCGGHDVRERSASYEVLPPPLAAPAPASPACATPCSPPMATPGSGCLATPSPFSARSDASRAVSPAAPRHLSLADDFLAGDLKGGVALPALPKAERALEPRSCLGVASVTAVFAPNCAAAGRALSAPTGDAAVTPKPLVSSSVVAVADLVCDDIARDTLSGGERSRVDFHRASLPRSVNVRARSVDSTREHAYSCSFCNVELVNRYFHCRACERNNPNVEWHLCAECHADPQRRAPNASAADKAKVSESRHRKPRPHAPETTCERPVPCQWCSAPCRHECHCHVVEFEERYRFVDPAAARKFSSRVRAAVPEA